jgi:hypothetical protein
MKSQTPQALLNNPVLDLRFIRESLD